MTALVSLDTKTGHVRRYTQHGSGRKEKTHDFHIDDWADVLSDVARLDGKMVEHFRLTGAALA